MRPKLWLRGGELSERTTIAEREDEIVFQFDINPQLPDDKRCRLRYLLKEYRDRFAINPKKPSIT